MNKVCCPTPLARRMSQLGTETAFEVLARARALESEGKDIVHLEIGEPDFGTPANIVTAAVDALNGGWTHYTPSSGLSELRVAIAQYVGKTREIEVNSEEVVVVPGGKPILFFTFLALVEAGDEVIYPNPGFPIYESLIHFVGAKPVPLRLRKELGFRVDPNALRDLISSHTKLIILNSPHNPTGSVLSEVDLQEIAAVIGDRDLMVLSDEIYSRLVFEGRHHSIVTLDGWKDRSILLDGFSKTYAMTGWRLGYGVMPTHLASAVTRLMTNSNSCTASFTQKAGIEALRGDQTSVERMCAEFGHRRDLFIDGINRIRGFSCQSPKGAFYAFPNIEQMGLDSIELAESLLAEAGVAVLPGTAFGEFGEGYLRFSVANSREEIQKALVRVEKWVKKRF
jgi:aspartate aminotransferase